MKKNFAEMRLSYLKIYLINKIFVNYNKKKYNLYILKI